MKHKDHKRVKKAKKDKKRSKTHRDDSKKSKKRDKEAKHKTESGPISSDPEQQINGDNKQQTEPVISDFDVLSIYADISKLSAVERYLNMLYRPFTCFVKTNCEFKLSELDCFLSDTRYEPDKHSALLIRLSSPICSLRLYDNGNICCQGYSYDSAALGIHRFIGTMEHLGYSPVFQNPKFNVVNATFCMPFSIHLEQLYREYHEDCLYNPETRPYLTYQIRNSSIKLAIFHVGYVYVLLSSQPRFTQKAIAFIMPILFRHRAANRPNVAELSSGDINFKLLWENEFQNAYQGTLKYSR
ncbi:TATA box-binding protein-like 1 [Drosophila virilis]|uniref:Uncharacterized protein, isoform A n=1 Tax=Drosophila virilis TaxID=7244 RepID=B4LUT6_DROVI|nr:TATA box-binding protein-like protein 1 [Drosophila virilis]XP_015028758.1 TATA box-binding protein-like protein 1 [Drosophila virilis]XP_015028759.1 TATA box-binding protein-like protein 1 [Drosophila virilis]EDW64263.1 uncharacterized protein Dvir_GJ23502, isoform A [Drosophila virilis]KRF81537.1 uncharacterized protein Dvir_GJ23502, isoform B [Drosophila virilis]KRF81538.1 uncharacterized protein Dvir_GJ23502, isoform C [Drosophila virilis]